MVPCSKSLCKDGASWMPGKAHKHQARAICRFAVSEEMWCRVAACAFLRSEIYDAKICTLVPAIVRRQAMQGMELESAVLESITWLYQHGKTYQV